MKPKELRLGNFVDVISNRAQEIQLPCNKVMKIGGIDFFSVKLYEYDKPFAVQPNVFEVRSSDLSPIPLTKEWLLKFGFEKRITVGHSVQYFIGKNPITHDWLFDILWLDGYSAPFYRNGFHKIQYVHQLQNLYYDLTGEELTIKQ
jgi:hypothetical protein